MIILEQCQLKQQKQSVYTDTNRVPFLNYLLLISTKDPYAQEKTEESVILPFCTTFIMFKVSTA